MTDCCKPMESYWYVFMIYSVIGRPLDAGAVHVIVGGLLMVGACMLGAAIWLGEVGARHCTEGEEAGLSSPWPWAETAFTVNV